ncbi:hypothetical protein FI667_g13221, partial [Globisporangium splendens]
MAQVPPLFANALRYAPGDQVRTPFGSGVVRSLSDQKAHVEVELAFGATLYARKHELRLAPRTRVRTKLGLGVILEYRKASDSYAVKLDFGGIGYIVPQDVSCVDLRLLEKVPKPLSAEQIVVQFEGRVTLEDAKVLSEKAHETYRRVQRFCEQHAETISFLSTNATYGDQYSKALGSLFDPSLAEAKDRIKAAGTNELEKLKQMAFSAKRTLESELLDGKDSSAFFAQAAKVLSQLKNSSEVKDLSDTLRSKANDELELAKKKMQIESNSPQGQRLVLSQVLQALESKVNAQKPKIEKVKSSLDQDTLQSELLTKLQQHEADFLKAQEAIAHLEKLASAKMGVMSLTSMDPSQLIAKAEELLPQVSKRAGVFMESTEKYLAQMQQTSQGQTLLKKAKQLVQSVDNPDAFCGNVTKAIADVKLDKLAEWGNTLTTNREKRQEFVNQVKDHCLDFFMSVLPSIKIDTISGIEEGIEYSMSNLDLSNFRVRKERVKVRMGTVADEELFTVRATHLTALLKGFQWTFAQKYFPYLNGGGLADAELTGGMISLGFKAEKMIVNKVTGEVRPTLVLNSMEIEIKQELKITVQGSWFSAVYNLLASVFAELIREYLAKTMESKLLGHMIKLLKTLNDQMDEYWPLIFQLLDIRVDDLPSASPWRGAKEVDIQPNQVECTFEDRSMVPFTFAKGVLHKHVTITSRITDVDDTNAELMRVPVGASVLAVNGLACNKLNLDEFKAILEKLAPPFTMRFSLAAEDTGMNRLQRVVPRQQFVSVTFKQDGPFGFRLRSRPLSPFGSIVVGFTESSADGKKSAAELSGKIQAGQLLLKVNDIDLRFKSLQETLQILKETTRRPTTLHFAPSPDGIIKLRDWPPMIEMELSDEEAADGRSNCVVSAFARVPSFAQKSHLVQKGDVLVRVNDVSMLTPIYEQNNFATIMETLKRISDAKQPMHAVFVSSEQYTDLRRQIWEAISLSASSLPDSVSQTETAVLTTNETDESKEESSKCVRVEDAVVTAFLATITPKEIAFPRAPLGILFGNLNDEAVYIRQFISSTGAAEKSGLIHVGQAVLQICGKTVPADATPAVIEQMIADVATRAKPPSSYTLTVSKDLWAVDEFKVLVTGTAIYLVDVVVGGEMIRLRAAVVLAQDTLASEAMRVRELCRRNQQWDIESRTRRGLAALVEALADADIVPDLVCFAAFGATKRSMSKQDSSDGLRSPRRTSLQVRPPPSYASSPSGYNSPGRAPVFQRYVDADNLRNGDDDRSIFQRYIASDARSSTNTAASPSFLPHKPVGVHSPRSQQQHADPTTMSVLLQPLGSPRVAPSSPLRSNMPLLRPHSPVGELPPETVVSTLHLHSNSHAGGGGGGSGRNSPRRAAILSASDVDKITMWLQSLAHETKSFASYFLYCEMLLRESRVLTQGQRVPNRLQTAVAFHCLCNATSVFARHEDLLVRICQDLGAAIFVNHEQLPIGRGEIDALECFSKQLTYYKTQRKVQQQKDCIHEDLVQQKAQYECRLHDAHARVGALKDLERKYQIKALDQITLRSTPQDELQDRFHVVLHNFQYMDEPEKQKVVLAVIESLNAHLTAETVFTITEQMGMHERDKLLRQLFQDEIHQITEKIRADVILSSTAQQNAILERSVSRITHFQSLISEMVRVKTAEEQDAATASAAGRALRGLARRSSVRAMMDDDFDLCDQDRKVLDSVSDVLDELDAERLKSQELTKRLEEAEQMITSLRWKTNALHTEVQEIQQKHASELETLRQGIPKKLEKEMQTDKHRKRRRQRDEDDNDDGEEDDEGYDDDDDDAVDANGTGIGSAGNSKARASRRRLVGSNDDDELILKNQRVNKFGVGIASLIDQAKIPSSKIRKILSKRKPLTLNELHAIIVGYYQTKLFQDIQDIQDDNVGKLRSNLVQFIMEIGGVQERQETGRDDRAEPQDDLWRRHLSRLQGHDREDRPCLSDHRLGVLVHAQRARGCAGPFEGRAAVTAASVSGGSNGLALEIDTVLEKIMAHWFSICEQQIQDIHAMFTLVDTNGDGILDFREFCELVVVLEPDIDRRDALALYNRAAGGDHVIDKDEFVQVMLAHQRGVILKEFYGGDSNKKILLGIQQRKKTTNSLGSQRSGAMAELDREESYASLAAAMNSVNYNNMSNLEDDPMAGDDLEDEQQQSSSSSERMKESVPFMTLSRLSMWAAEAKVKLQGGQSSAAANAHARQPPKSDRNVLKPVVEQQEDDFEQNVDVLLRQALSKVNIDVDDLF